MGCGQEHCPSFLSRRQDSQDRRRALVQLCRCRVWETKHRCEENRSSTRSAPCCIGSSKASGRLQARAKPSCSFSPARCTSCCRRERTKKILCNFVVQGPGPYCELKPNAGSDRTWVWKIPSTGGEPDHLGLKVASKELASQFKGIFEGAKMLNDAAAAASGMG